jgi:hypothetical protein
MVSSPQGGAAARQVAGFNEAGRGLRSGDQFDPPIRDTLVTVLITVIKTRIATSPTVTERSTPDQDGGLRGDDGGREIDNALRAAYAIDASAGKGYRSLPQPSKDHQPLAGPRGLSYGA